MYSRQLANQVKKTFIDNDCEHYFDDEAGIFKVVFGLDCGLERCKVLVGIGEDNISAHGYIDLNVDEDDRLRVSEFITRANWGMKFGHFVLDFSDGEISYINAVDCSDGFVPSEDAITTLIGRLPLMFELYGDGLLSVLLGVLSPKEAIEECEAKF